MLVSRNQQLKVACKFLISAGEAITNVNQLIG